MKKLYLIMAICFLSISSANAATINVASPYGVTQVNSAISSASTNDTVAIPACNVSWSSGVTIPNNKKITLQGAGKTSTIITMSSYGSDIINLGASGSRITGIKIINGIVNTQGYGFRIDHCDFTNSGSWFRSIVSQSLNTSSPVVTYGLIDNNSFTNSGIACNGTNMMHGDDNLVAQHTLAAIPPSWGEPTSAVYIEGNTFTGGIDSVDSNYSGRYVIRFNAHYYSGAQIPYIETHQAGESTPAGRGVRYYESYNNSFASGSTWVSFLLTAGTGMIFNNTMSGSYSEGPIMLEEQRSGSINPSIMGYCDGNSVWDGNSSGQTGWPCRDQIGRGVDAGLSTGGTSGPYNLQAQASTPLYVWGNTLNGSGTNAYVRWGSTTHVQANRDYYDYNASFNGTSGIGSGTLANRPATCTTGVAYWATDQGSWNKSVSGGQGVLYKCTATNTWTLYYTPYTYPHPLQGGTTPDPNPPVRSAILPQTERACDAESPVDVTLSLTTDETATCKYCVDGVGGCNSTTAYASMANTFGTTNSTSHSTVASLACDASYVVHIRCTDGTNPNTTDATSSFNITPASADTDAPLLSSVFLAADGRTLALTFNEAVKFGAGGSGGVTITPSGGAATVTYSSGEYSGALFYITNRVILQTETLTTTFTQAGDMIEDSAGNIKTSFTNQATTNNSTQNPIIGTGITIWPDTVDTTGDGVWDGLGIEVGIKFQSSVAGVIKAIRFYKREANTGTHVGNIWTVTGTNKGTVTFADETASGWQQQSFATPIHIAANTQYIASVFMPSGLYQQTNNYFLSSGVSNGALSTPQSTLENLNGVWEHPLTESAFPNNGSVYYQNFWVDVVFEVGSTMTINVGVGPVTITIGGGNATITW